MRDLNDIHVCLRQAEDRLDWDYLSHFSRKNSLQAILYGLLARLGSDDEVELPREVLSNLKPKSFENIASKALFSAGRENPNFHGGRQLVAGRFLQSVFLYNYYRDRTNFLTALRESISGLYSLFQSGRPYLLWEKRKIQSFGDNRRIVIVPIEPATNTVKWQIERVNLQEVENFAKKARLSVEWISREILVWDVGHPNELILTPEGFYTQSAYNGDIDEVVLEEIQGIACEVTAQLQQTGAIQAKRVEVCRVSEKAS